MNLNPDETTSTQALVSKAAPGGVSVTTTASDVMILTTTPAVVPPPISSMVTLGVVASPTAAFLKALGRVTRGRPDATKLHNQRDCLRKEMLPSLQD